MLVREQLAFAEEFPVKEILKFPHLFALRFFQLL